MELLAAAVSALGLGIVTSISPCPLATNIAAVSYIGRRVGKPRLVLSAGLLYALGRTLAYVALGVAIVAGLTTLTPERIVLLLRRYMNLLLGPFLIVVGMFLLELVRFNVGGTGVSEKMQKRVDALGVWGALVLGMVFALSFCPTSAAWFFFSLIPLAITVDSSVALPTVYGVGTALPVLVFATLIALSAQSVGKAFGVVSKIEWWARRVTGVIFVLAGIFFSLRYCFDLPI